MYEGFLLGLNWLESFYFLGKFYWIWAGVGIVRDMYIVVYICKGRM